MELAPIVARLESQLSGFKKIGGAADLEAIGNGVVPTPSCYVVMTRETARDIDLVGGYEQAITVGFGVVIAVANRFDATGGAAIDVLDALRAGASGYVLKRNPDQLPPAIRHVHAGEVWLDPAVAGHVLAALAAQPRPGLPDALVGLLTAREREVLALLADGLSNHEMAQRLFVGVGTIKTHMSRILFKTGCRDRAQATALAFTSGLVTAS